MAVQQCRRVIWLILDGLGFRHWERVRAEDPASLPAISRFTGEGIVVSSQPSSPVCQTPAALFTLFSGVSPLRHGIWGYRMPAGGAKPHRSISGFSARPLEGRPIWEDLEENGLSYSLMNVAFRNDSVWKEPRPGLSVAYDGYRTLRGTREYCVKRGWRIIRFKGMDLRVRAGKGSMEIRKGGRRIGRAPTGRMTQIRLTRGTRGIAFPLDAGTLFLFSANEAVTRGGEAGEMKTLEFFDAQVFKAMRAGRRDRPGEEVPPDTEMAPAVASFTVQRRVALEMLDCRRTSLAILYFPLIDYINHAYMDLVDAEWPRGHGSEVLRRGFSLVDGLVGDLCARCGPDDLLVVSSDHGAVPFRRVFHLNELFAEAGLLPRKGGRFLFHEAAAYYHPSECGLVLFQERAARRLGMDRSRVLALVREIPRLALSLHGVPVGMQDGPKDASWLSLLYPLDDTSFSSAPCPHPGKPVRGGKAGGHHISPLCPSAWIPSVLGIWGPDRKRLPSTDRVPTRNEDVKRFLLETLDCVPTGGSAIKSKDLP